MVETEYKNTRIQLALPPSLLYFYNVLGHKYTAAVHSWSCRHRQSSHSRHHQSPALSQLLDGLLIVILIVILYSIFYQIKTLQVATSDITTQTHLGLVSTLLQQFLGPEDRISVISNQ